MEISDDFYLRNIKKRNAYFDRESIEPFTKSKRPKYKLAGDPIITLEIYSFFILNKSDSACIKDLTLFIHRDDDWEERDPNHLTKSFSYIDISKCETLTRNELLSKIKDKKNKFKCVARLCDRKFQELRNLLFNLQKNHIRSRISQETKKTLGAALDVAEEFKKKLGLQ